MHTEDDAIWATAEKFANQRRDTIGGRAPAALSVEAPAIGKATKLAPAKATIVLTGIAKVHRVSYRLARSGLRPRQRPSHRTPLSLNREARIAAWTLRQFEHLQFIYERVY